MDENGFANIFPVPSLDWDEVGKSSNNLTINPFSPSPEIRKKKQIKSPMKTPNTMTSMEQEGEGYGPKNNVSPMKRSITAITSSNSNPSSIHMEGLSISTDEANVSNKKSRTKVSKSTQNSKKAATPSTTETIKISPTNTQSKTTSNSLDNDQNIDLKSDAANSISMTSIESNQIIATTNIKTKEKSKSKSKSSSAGVKSNPTTSSQDSAIVTDVNADKRINARSNMNEGTHKESPYLAPGISTTKSSGVNTILEEKNSKIGTPQSADPTATSKLSAVNASINGNSAGSHTNYLTTEKGTSTTKSKASLKRSRLQLGKIYDSSIVLHLTAWLGTSLAFMLETFHT